MGRTSWLDDEGQTTLIDNYAQKLGSFVEAIADGRVETTELASQEKRLVDLMRQVEPQLDDRLHEQVTQLLCELSAFNAMQFLHDLTSQRPRTKFVG
jgi:hypothetical protein